MIKHDGGEFKRETLMSLSEVAKRLANYSDHGSLSDEMFIDLKHLAKICLEHSVMQEKLKERVKLLSDAYLNVTDKNVLLEQQASEASWREEMHRLENLQKSYGEWR